jgi:hypothetical protein
MIFRIDDFVKERVMAHSAILPTNFRHFRHFSAF